MLVKIHPCQILYSKAAEIATKLGQKEKAFFFAVKGGFFNIVRELLEDRNLSPSCLENAPIKTAAENGFIDIVKLLLEYVAPL